MNFFLRNKSQATKTLDDRMKKAKNGQVSSKSSVNIQGLNKQDKNNGCTSIYYTFKNICPKC